MVAAAVAVGAVAATAVGSMTASDAQDAAGGKAIATQKQYYDDAQQDLSPYMDLGKQGESDLSSRLNELTSPISMNESDLEQTPGYQFNLNQGLKSVQNSAAARGLGSSGAAMKGAASYATGLADSTYQNQFNNAVTNQSNAFNRLMGVTSLGANSANSLANYGITTGTGVASTQVGIGNANAAADNAIGSSVGKAGMNYLMMA